MISKGLKVLWLARRSYSAGEAVEPHYHDFYHFIYVLSPGGHVEVSKTRYATVENVLFMASRNTSHGIFPGDGPTMRTIELKAIIAEPALARELSALPPLFADTTSVVRRTLENLLAEGVDRRQHYRDMINVKFAELLIHLLRGIESDASRADLAMKAESLALEQSGTRINFSPVLEYMRVNVAKAMELEELASIVNMQPSYFCKLFQNEFGLPPIQYLLQLRIQYARSLLLDSRLTISEIAYRVGFQSVHYFSRYFSKKEHLSPVQYRERYQDEHSYIVLVKDGYSLYGNP